MRFVKLYKTAAIFVIAALCLCLASSLALFTDKEDTKASASTVTNGIDIVPLPDPYVEPDDPDNPNKPGGTADPDEYKDPTPKDPTDDLTNWWLYLNSKATVNYNPGDKMTLNYILVNKGDLPVDIRETFIITSSVPMDDKSPEFELFSGIGLDDYGGYAGTDLTAPAGAKVTVNHLSNTKHKYVIQEFTLSSAKEKVGTKPTQLGREYYIVFSGPADNDFQGALCTIEYIVEAKQHSEGGAADWVIATTGTVKLPVSGTQLPVVPAN